MFLTLPQMVYEKAQKISGQFIQMEKDKMGVFQPITYSDAAETMLDFASGLLALGAKTGDHIGLISDNRKEWLICSMGIMAIGAADIPRGNEATVKDLSYILSFAECQTVILESNYSYKKIIDCLDELPLLKNIILIDANGVDKSAVGGQLHFFDYSEILTRGKEYRTEKPGEIENLMLSRKGEETATIIFTSGTTGTPKGVELTHENFICQLKDIGHILPLKTGDKALCVLPVWHVYEREIEYCLIYLECALCYSKPIGSVIMADLKKVEPNFMACVPRVWDAIYKAIQKQVGAVSTQKWLLFKTCVGSASSILRMHDIIHGRKISFKRTPFILKIFNKVLCIPILFLLPFRALGEMVFFKKARKIFGNKFKIGVSGGGGLAPKLDKFYNAIGLRLVEGYGLTETAPICALRNYKRAVLGTIGRVMPYCESKILDKNGNECPPGKIGVLYIKGKNVMKGYYKQPELTSEAMTDGWFNTGDLVLKTYKGDIMVKGRQKDTIVLRSGENVEPFPIEAKLAESPYILQAVVVGQDKNCLGALIIPSKDAIQKYADENGIALKNIDALLKSDEIKNLIFKEFERLITQKNGFKPFEKIGRFAFLDKQFEVGVELSAKQDIVRYKINELYKWQITMMFSDLNIPQNLNIAQNLQNLQDGISNITTNLQGGIHEGIAGLANKADSIKDAIVRQLGSE